MNRRLAPLAFAAALGLSGLFAPLLRAESVVQRGDLVALCGDSITARRIYTLYIQEYLQLCAPVADLSTVQAGRGFDTAAGFVARLENDVLTFKPSVATLCFGMNDGKYSPVSADTVDGYRKNLTEAIRLLKAGGVRTIIAGSPGVVDPAKFKQPRVDPARYNETLARLRDAARDVAKAENVIFADIYTPMLDAMTQAKAKFGADYILANDGIHPNPNGHLIFAYAFLKALGFDGDLGVLTVDFASGRTAGSPGHTVLGYANGVLKIESTRYPFCFENPQDPTGSRALTPFVPFNNELNRYRLVVKNAPARTRITWGSMNREFTAAELSTGINLAEAFPENPFCAPFFAAAKVMKEQQDFEDQSIRVLLNSLLDWRKDYPASAPQTRILADLVAAKSVEKRAASRAAIRPVTHELKIEAVR